MRNITLKEWKVELARQGMGKNEDLAFVCPCCRTVQSARDLIAAGAGKTWDDVQGFVAFSCVGRWTDAGAADFKNGKPREGKRGCNWTLGGLLQMHELAVVTTTGEIVPRFELATPEQAQHLKETHDERSVPQAAAPGSAGEPAAGNNDH